MRKEPGQINPRIAVIVNEGGTGDRNGRRGEGERDVVGERVARVVGGMQQKHQQQQQQQQRLALAVPVLELPRAVGSGTSGNENGYTGTRDTVDDGAANELATAEGVVLLESPCSAFPPLSPSPSPSPICGPGSSKSPTTKTQSKLGKRVIESRLRLSRNALHRRWWQRRLKNKYYNPCDHILSSCSRRLQRINQRIEIITKKHQILRYDRIAEKYLHWENHLREQMMIRRWGTKKNVELDRERRAELVKLEHLQKRRDVLVKMISAKGL